MLDPDTIRSAAERNIQLLNIRPGRGLLTGKTTARLVDGCAVRSRTAPGAWPPTCRPRLAARRRRPRRASSAAGALASCLAIGIATWGARLGVPIDAVEVEVEADFDARGELGIGEGVVPGYTEVRYPISIDSPAPADQITELLDVGRAPQPLSGRVRPRGGAPPCGSP